MGVNRFISITVFGIFVLSICLVNGQELNSNEGEAKIFLSLTSDKMFNFFDELVDNEYYFDLNVHYNHYKTNRNYINFVNKIVEDSRKFDFKNFKDEKLKYAFKILVQLADENIIGVAPYLRILESLKELDYLPKYKEIPQYRKIKNKLAYSSDVEKIFSKSSDEKEIIYYWSVFRRTAGKWGEQNLSLLIEGLKDAAKLNDLSPLEFWSRGFNITDMDSLMWDIRPLYFELHAFVRNLIQKKFGESVIGANNLIPAHLFEHIKFQIMTNESIIEEMFPYLSHSPKPFKESFEARILYKIAEQFYADLGFEKYPPSIWGDRIKQSEDDYNDDDYSDDYISEEEDEKEEYDDDDDDDNDNGCQKRVIYKTPNVYLKFCEKVNFKNFLDIYKDMGYIYYAKEMVGLPAYFFNPSQGLDLAIGKTVVLSASTHENLKAVGLIPDIESNKKVEMNRLLRLMALRSILYLPLEFVHAKVMTDLLSGKITNDYLNDYYWDMMKAYAGVKKPDGHETRTYDFSIQFYKDMNGNGMSSKFTTEILSYQIQKKLCELSGKYPKEPLHLCNINGSNKAGNALKNMMQFGKSEPFYKVLASMFPENPEVSAEGLMEYYKPLKDLLCRQNKKEKLKLGWDDELPKAEDNDKLRITTNYFYRQLVTYVLK